jgi:uncharacterized membrane protein
VFLSKKVIRRPRSDVLAKGLVFDGLVVASASHARRLENEGPCLRRPVEKRNRNFLMYALTAVYLTTSLTFVVVDMTWLSIMAPRFYRPTLDDIAISGVNLPPAVLFYAIYPIGLMIFAVQPALRTGSPLSALIYGALFGFFTYATYDLTNQATLRNWTLQLTSVDVAWGTVLGALASYVGFLAASRLWPVA